jgi:uncharacterized membrane protein
MDATSSMQSSAKPTRDVLWMLCIVLASLGLLITAYLTISKFTDTATICPQTSTFNCDLVQNSIYNKVGPIPVAYIGLAGYVTILLVLALEPTIPFLTVRGKLIVFVLTLIGTLFSGYLTSVEAFALHVWCVWCLGSAITMTVLFVVAFIRQWRSMNVLPDLEEELDEA